MAGIIRRRIFPFTLKDSSKVVDIGSVLKG